MTTNKSSWLNRINPWNGMTISSLAGQIQQGPIITKPKIRLDYLNENYITEGFESLADLKRGPLTLVPTKIYIAGGLIRSLYDGTTPGDIDYFFGDRETFQDAKYLLDHLADKFEVLENKSSYGSKYRCRKSGVIVNLVNKKYGRSGNAICSDFDFTACAMAYDGEEFYTAQSATLDAGGKILRPHSKSEIRNLPYRVQKYLDKGYTLCDRFHGKVADLYYVEYKEDTTHAIYTSVYQNQLARANQNAYLNAYASQLGFSQKSVLNDPLAQRMLFKGEEENKDGK